MTRFTFRSDPDSQAASGGASGNGASRVETPPSGSIIPRVGRRQFQRSMIVTPLDKFFAWRRRRRLSRIAKQAETRRAVIKDQIEYRKVNHREFKPLYGSLRDSTHEALAAECGIDWPDRIKESW